MKIGEIRDWIKRNFLPTVLATENKTIEQHILTTIRYWNTHSAYAITRSHDIAGFQIKTLEIGTDTKTVVACYPNDMKDDYFAQHPMYVLLGYVTLDRFTQDFMLIANTYEAYRRWLNADYRWHWERSEDPTKKGRLYIQNIPRGVTRLTTMGLKRILPDEDIVDEHILEWILEYSKALVKITEGIVLRKAGIIGITTDGADFVTEGQTEVKDLQERLRQEARWAMLAVRL